MQGKIKKKIGGRLFWLGLIYWLSGHDIGIVKKHLRECHKKKIQPFGRSNTRTSSTSGYLCATALLTGLLLITLLGEAAGTDATADVLRSFDSNPPPCVGADNNLTHGDSPFSSRCDHVRSGCTEANRQPPDPITPAGGQDARPLRYYDWLDATVEKIWQAESSGRLACPDGDGGLSHGPLQIQQGVLDDINSHYGTDYTTADTQSIETAKHIAKLYITRWVERHKEEIACRIFNGGPRGWRKKSTDTYWNDIRRQNEKANKR